MNASNPEEPSPSEQANYWDAWNARWRETTDLSRRVQKQVALFIAWLKSLGRMDMKVLDVGCGSGWLCALLLPFGMVTGIDFTEEVLARARSRNPEVRYITGDFFDAGFKNEFDVVVSMEVISHINDQSGFIHKCWEALKPGGYLMLATQNKYVYEHRAETVPPSPSQVRKWLTPRTLRKVLEPEFEILQVTSVYPDGHKGMLRFVNSPRFNRLVARVVPQEQLDAMKERMLLGMTLMALAQKPMDAVPAEARES
jgi:2-polyprenyl-3-methyl-5-hydroxy-6-metoxy-1,4-benzoquinol methylase